MAADGLTAALRDRRPTDPRDRAAPARARVRARSPRPGNRARRAARSTGRLSSTNRVRRESKHSRAARRGQNPGHSLTSPNSCAEYAASTRRRSPRCASLIASISGCALVTSMIRRPAARSRARKSRAIGSHAIWWRVALFNAAISRESAWLQYSTQYQLSVPLVASWIGCMSLRASSTGRFRLSARRRGTNSCQKRLSKPRSSSVPSMSSNTVSMDSQSGAFAMPCTRL